MHSGTTANVAATTQAEKQEGMPIILTLLVATFVVILNETVMNVALPRLMVDLQVSASTVQWLTTAFLLVMAVLIPTTGFLIQRFSTRSLYIVAMSVFSLGTLTAALAPNFEVLLIGRVLQASGTAIMLPLLTTVILGLVPVHRRGAMMGTVGIVISVAPAIGPTISGVIIQSLSWRYMFVFVLPIALAVLAYGAWKLVNVGETSHASLDIPSVLLAGFGFGGIVYGFSGASETGWGSTQVLAPLGVGALSLALFVWRQLRLETPLLDLRAFRYRMFSLSVGMMMVVMMALFASAILLPIYLQNIRRFAPLETGLLLLPGGVLLGISGPIVGRLFDRYGPRILVMVGSTLVAATLGLFTTVTADTPVLVLLAQHAAFSLGLGLLFTPVMTTGLNQLPRVLYPHGSAISSTLQQVSGAIGTALLVTIMSVTNQAYLRGSNTPDDPAVQSAALTAGLHTAFGAAAILAVLAIVIGLFLRRATPPDEPVGAEGQPALSMH